MPCAPPSRVRRVIEELNVADPHLALQVRIGIATGEVLTNLRADPSRGETTVAGDIVNTAARLQQTAPPGAIVVGRGTYEATERGGRVSGARAGHREGKARAGRGVGGGGAPLGRPRARALDADVLSACR